MRGSGLPGRGFSCSVVSGSPGAALEVHSSWEHFNITEADLQQARALLEWYRSPDCPVSREALAEPEGAEPEAKKARSEMMTVEQLATHRSFCDFTGQVLAKFRMQPFPQCLLLRLWDGTAPQSKVRNVENLAADDVTDVEVRKR